MNPKFIPLLIVPPILGWLFLHLFLRKSQLPLKNLFAVFFAPASGFALVSLSLFACYVFHPQSARLTAVLLPWFFILIFMTLLSFSPDNTVKNKMKPWTVKYLFSLPGSLKPADVFQLALSGLLTALFIFTLINFSRDISNAMVWNPFGGWDTRYFWHLKSRFLFRDPEQWRLIFSNYLNWGNNDYPLMIPGVIAWGWHFIGREALLWPMIVSLVFVCSLGALVIWYLAVWCSWISALTAGVFFFTLPAYVFWGGTLYCDIPYAFFSNSALLLLISALRLKDTRLLALSAFFAGCSAFTKNEGLVFLVWYGLLAAAALCFEYRQAKKLFFKNILAIAAGLLLPLWVCLYLKVGLTDGHTHIIAKSSPADILAALSDWPRNRVILAGFQIYLADPKNWNGLWFLLLAAIVYWPIRRKLAPSPYSGILLLAILLINLGYALIFTVTPNNIYRHIETALMRLLLQTGALALVFVFETFSFSKSKKPSKVLKSNV